MKNPIISCITGTWNRLPYLKQFVDSVRRSAPTGLTLDFVITDGGSTDGSLEWMEEQPDITIIRHGKLLGAIKAFNDAADAATGHYLLVGNDDIKIVGNSVAKGMSYMLDHPEVGAGCFLQDRGKQDPHVEYLEVVDQGKRKYSPYLQVGLIPRWLWQYENDYFQKGWGDYGSQTYGGDSYVSAKVLSLGYKIEPIEGSLINDLTPYDELRMINNEHNKGGADGQKFYDQFPNGIPYKRQPQVNNPLPRIKKLVYAPIIEPGHVQAKLQKKGLRDALARNYAVWEVDYCYTQESISEACKIWKPDVVLTQIHSADKNMVEEIKKVRQECKGSLINWNGDIWPESQEDKNYLEMLSYFDIQTGINMNMKPVCENHGIRYEYMQCSFEPNILPKESRR